MGLLAGFVEDIEKSKKKTGLLSDIVDQIDFQKDPNQVYFNPDAVPDMENFDYNQMKVVEPQTPPINRNSLFKNIGTIAQAYKLIATDDKNIPQKYRIKDGEIYDRIRNMRDRTFSSLAYLLPGVSKSELIAELDKESEQFGGMGAATTQAAGEIGNLAVEMAAFQKAFGAVDKVAAAAGKLPAAEKVAQAIKGMGGIEKFAETYPRIYQASVKAGGAFAKGNVVGQAYGALQGVDEGEEVVDVLKRMQVQGAQMGTVSAVFNLAQSADRAIYTTKLRQEMIRRLDGQLQQKISELPKGTSPKNLESFRDNGLKQIDNIVSAVEADLAQMTKGKVFGGQKTDSPYKAAEQFMKEGFTLKGASQAKVGGVKSLKKGLGVNKPMQAVPTTKTAQIKETLKAIKTVAKDPGLAIQQAQSKLPRDVIAPAKPNVDSIITNFPEFASAIAGKENPSRKDFADIGYKNTSAEERKQIAAELKVRLAQNTADATAEQTKPKSIDKETATDVGGVQTEQPIKPLEGTPTSLDKTEIAEGKPQAAAPAPQTVPDTPKAAPVKKGKKAKPAESTEAKEASKPTQAEAYQQVKAYEPVNKIKGGEADNIKEQVYKDMGGLLGRELGEQERRFVQRYSTKEEGLGDDFLWTVVKSNKAFMPKVRQEASELLVARHGIVRVESGKPKSISIAKKPKDILKAIDSHAAADSTRYAINGFNVNGNGDIAATDGKRLLVIKKGSELIPDMEKGKLYAFGGTKGFVVREDGIFPKYEDIIPDSYDSKTTISDVDAERVVDIIKQTKKVNPGAAYGTEGYYAAAISGPGYDLGFQAAFMEDALTTLVKLGAEEIVIKTDGAARPLLLEGMKGGSVTAQIVAMPIKLTDAKMDNKVLNLSDIMSMKPKKGKKPTGTSGRLGSPAQGKLTLEPEPKFKTKPLSTTKIVKALSKAFNVPIHTMATHKPRAAAGWYEVKPKGIRQVDVNSITVAAHEVGHHIDHHFRIRNKDKKGRYVAPAGTRAELLALGKALYGNKKPVGGYQSEGVAEFVRGYMIDEDAIKAKAPNFHKWFTETFLKENPNVAKELKKAQQLYSLYQQQGARSRIRAQRVKGNIKTSVAESAKKIMLKMETDWRDEFAPILRGMKDVGIDTDNLKPTEDPYFLATVFADKAGARSMFWATEGMTNLAGEITGPSLKEIFKPVVDDVERFLDWAQATKALQLEKLGIQSGLEISDAKYIHNKDKNDVYEKVLADWTKWSHGGLNYMVEAGAMPEAVADKIKKRHEIYIPFNRAFEKGEVRRGGAGKGFTDAGKPVKKIKGSGRPIEDPIMSSLVNMEKIVSVSHKVMVTKALARLADEEGIADFIWRVPAPRKATSFKAEQIKKDIVKLAEERLGVDMQGIPLSELGEWDDILTVFTNAETYRGKETIIAIEVDGKKQWFEVNGDLFGVLKGLDQYTLPWYLDVVFGKATRALRIGATGVNASFGLLRNPMRDIATFTVLAKHAKSPLAALGGIAKDVASKAAGVADEFGLDLPESKIVKRFDALGGKMSVQVLNDRRGQKHLRAKVLASGGKRYTIYTASHPIEALKEMVGITESGTRLGEFEKALEYAENKWGKGADAAFYALYHAQDVTTNFTRHGKAAKKLNQAVAFFNAAIQGPDKILRTMRQRPLRFLLSALAWLTLPAIWAWWKNKDKEWWKNLADHEKYGYLHHEVPGKEDVIVRIPVPFELGHAFQTLPMAVLDAWYQKDPQEVIDAFKYSVNTANPMDWPAVVSPFIDIKENENFAGVPIVSKAAEGKVKELQYDRKTTNLMRYIGKKTGQSPAQTEHLVNSYSGGVYRRLYQWVDTMEKDPENKLVSDFPVLGTLFMREPYAPRKQVQEFYARRDELSRRYRSRKEMPMTGREVALYKRYETVADKLSDLWKRLHTAETTKARKKIYASIKKLTEAAEPKSQPSKK